jgi:hypothetical protein
MDDEMWKPDEMSMGKKAVIVTILIVIVVVIAGALYSMVLTPPSGQTYPTPLGLLQEGKTVNPLTLRIVHTPEGAMVSSSSISLMHNYTPLVIDELKLYNATDVELADYSTNSGWHFVNGSDANSLIYTVGVKMVLYRLDEINLGDIFIISSSSGDFATTTYTIP